jgi:hypothetical protein
MVIPTYHVLFFLGLGCCWSLRVRRVFHSKTVWQNGSRDFICWYCDWTANEFVQLVLTKIIAGNESAMSCIAAVPGEDASLFAAGSLAGDLALVQIPL